MRFSEMMGSGSERTSKSRTRSGTDTATAGAAVTEALSPYLDAQTPAIPLDVATSLDPTPARRAWPVERPVPAPPVDAMMASAAPEPVADFTPLSDDLLPHRR